MPLLHSISYYEWSHYYFLKSLSAPLFSENGKLNYNLLFGHQNKASKMYQIIACLMLAYGEYVIQFFCPFFHTHSLQGVSKLHVKWKQPLLLYCYILCHRIIERGKQSFLHSGQWQRHWWRAHNNSNVMLGNILSHLVWALQCEQLTAEFGFSPTRC